MSDQNGGSVPTVLISRVGEGGIPQVNGKAVTNWRKWLSLRKSAERIGKNARAFRMLIKDGDLPPALECPDGSLRWDPAVLDGYSLDPDDDDDDDQIMRGGPGADLKSMGVGLAKVLSVATSQTERNFQLLQQPQQLAMEGLREDLLRARADNEKLRDKLAERDAQHFEMLKARESLISEQAFRDIAQSESSAGQARKKQMFDILLQRAPKLLGQLEKSLGLGDGQDMIKVNAVIELASDLDPGLLEMLAGSGSLTPKQVTLVETIIGKKIAAAEAAEGEKQHHENQRA